MSWSHYATYGSVEAAVKDVTELKEPTPEQNYGMPTAAKKLILDAIALCGVAPAVDPKFTVGLKIEAGGHSPGGNCKVFVEPVVFKL